MGATRMRDAFATDLSTEDAPWGYASGWAQLYGQRRNVSCVVVGLQHATGLPEMFDSLSDALTEAGYPWEVLMVDTSQGAQLSRVLAGWGERPGFRRVALPAGTTATLALRLGLARARGDAIVLMQAHGGELAVPIPEMVLRWSDGLKVVRSRWVGLEHRRSANGRACAPQAPSSSAATALADALERLLGEEAILLDRGAVETMLGEAP
jgi:hypothetical protein